MNEIKKIVKQRLNEEYEISQKIGQTMSIQDDNEKMSRLVDILEELYNNGYNDNDVEILLEQDFLGTLQGKKVVDAAKGGTFSQVKEWLLRELLKMLGFKGPLRDAVATTLADVSLPELINVFKSNNGCNQYGNNVITAISEGLLVYISGGTEKNSPAENWLRNTVVAYIKKTNLPDKIKPYLCSMLHKKRGSQDITPQLPPNVAKQVAPQTNKINDRLPLQTKK